MRLPFSHDAFLEVFGAFNLSLWPAAVLLWVATAVASGFWFWGWRLQGRYLYAILVAHWAWSGIAYHWFYFREINPAATLFAAVFVLQAALLTWLAARSRAPVPPPVGVRGTIGAALVLCGLAYPFIGLGLGLEYPRLPLFGVPCPTTLVTAGFLILMLDAPRASKAVPALWAAVGSSAAFVLGIKSDLLLIIAAGVLSLDMVAPSALGRRKTSPG